MTTAPSTPAAAETPPRESSSSDALFGLQELDLFDGFGKTRVNGSHPLKCKVETFEAADRWGEFEAPKTIRIHSELSKRDALVILFHEAAHALWKHETLGKKEDEETVCEKIAEGLARMVLGNALEPWIAAAKAESWEIPRHKMESPREALALDCEGIERAVAANKCVRNAPIDYRPWDMFSHAAISTHNPDGTRRNLDWKPRNRYLVRQGVKAVRRARERVKESMSTEPPRAWAVHFELLELAEYSLRVRYYWRNGERADFDPASAADAERLERERNWYARMMSEWDLWSRHNGPTPSQEAMYAAMHALSLLRADSDKPNQTKP